MNARDNASITDQAAQWIGALERGGPREHAEFAAWLRRSPQHVKEYLMMLALEKEFEGVDAERSFDVEALLAQPEGNVVALEKPTATTPVNAKKSWRRPIGIAASLLAVLAMTLWLTSHPPGSETYTTAIGEHRSIQLTDGSLVQLSPASRLRVRLTAATRDLRLLDGEATFKVEPDRTRPFLVYTGDTLIKDIGTEFHVYRRPTSTVVSVLEGAVQVSRERKWLGFKLPAGSASQTKPTLIQAGHKARIPATGNRIESTTLDATQIAALRQQRLIFSGDTLSDIVDEFNRYNRTPQIRVEGEALKNKQFSGSFDANDPESLVDYLMRHAGLSIRRDAGTIVLQSVD